MINWPDFNVAVFQGIGRLEKRERDREWPVGGAVRAHTELIKFIILRGHSA